MKQNSTTKVLVIAFGTAAVTVMLILPLLTLHTLPPWSGWAVYVTLLLVANPLVFIGTGVAAGLYFRALWWLPLAAAAVFAAGALLFIGVYPAETLGYTIVYLLAAGLPLGVTAAAKRLSARKARKKQQDAEGE